MQRLALALVTGIVVLLITSTAQAELKMPLGKWNAAVKVDYLQFTDDVFDEEYELFEGRQSADGIRYDTSQVVDSTQFWTNDGAYISVETFANVWESVYIGAEIGYVKTEKDITDWINQRSSTAHWGVRGSYFYDLSSEIEYMPVQINVKYVLEPTENLFINFGGGISYNYADVKISQQTTPGSVYESGSESLDDWLFGGQIFGEIVYKINQFFVGISGAYQFTEDFDADDDGEDAPNFNNFRLGGKIGFYF